MRIVFMGTPEFAVPALEALHRTFDVCAVITAPDRPAGRGKKLTSSAVKQSADRLGIPVLQPTNLKDLQFIETLLEVNADIFVVVAFRMLPTVVFEMPPMGCINLHASLLPDYRGAAPINWAIINGETKTGLTTFLIEREIDTGLILKQVEIPIGGTTTAGELHDEMMTRGAELLVETIDGLRTGLLKGQPQTLDQARTYHAAPKLYRETGKIDWSQSAKAIDRFIRGLSPYPGAFSEMIGIDQAETMKIWRAKPSSHQSDLAAGEIRIADQNILTVGCGNGTLELKEIQIPGKARIEVADFLRGLRNPERLRLV